MTTRVCVRGKWNFPCLKCKGSEFKLIDGKYYLYCADLEEEIKKQAAYQVDPTFKDIAEGRFKTFTDIDALFKDLDEPEKKPCDMVDTDLCIHYQKQIQCHYESTHNVKCLIETGVTE